MPSKLFRRKIRFLALIKCKLICDANVNQASRQNKIYKWRQYIFCAEYFPPFNHYWYD